jgi:hypothetical protein
MMDHFDVSDVKPHVAFSVLSLFPVRTVPQAQCKRWLMVESSTVACRSAKEEAINRIEEKSRALQSMHEQVTADLARVDQRNKQELQINDQLLASMQVPFSAFHTSLTTECTQSMTLCTGMLLASGSSMAGRCK